CPHLNPIERLWGLMHRHTTHNKCYSSFRDFSIAMLRFLRDDVPRNWRTYCDEVTDNFRVIDPKKFRIIVWAGYISASEAIPACSAPRACNARQWSWRKRFGCRSSRPIFGTMP